MRWRSRHLAASRAVLIGVVLAGYMLASALAGSPQLHDFLHHDADQSQHVCLATTLHAGAFEPIVAVIAAERAVTPVAKIEAPDLEAVPSFFLRCRLLRHGPPEPLLS